MQEHFGYNSKVTNTGLREAKGDFITLLDSDEYSSQRNYNIKSPATK
ncbi:MAG: hypothetical protein ACFFC3_12005 [Candidatus Odinarchaeota archaeon]